jgi:hypothetical protein
VTDNRVRDQNPPAGSIDVVQTPDQDGDCWHQQSEKNEDQDPTKRLTSYGIKIQKFKDAPAGCENEVEKYSKEPELGA